jgi:hypothetical protein
MYLWTLVDEQEKQMKDAQEHEIRPQTVGIRDRPSDIDDNRDDRDAPQR